MNIYDIAREADVSITTVSRVLNHKQNISLKTRERVENVLEKHNYVPNVFARGLMSSSIKTIGIMTANICDPHDAKAVYIIEQEFSKLGYSVVLCNTSGKMAETICYLKMLQEKKVDGLILSGSLAIDRTVSHFIADYASHLPIVIANGQLEEVHSHAVLVDDFYGISRCVEHLYLKNHTRIFYVNGARTDSGERKREGFIAGMHHYGLPVTNETIINVEHGLAGGYEAVEKLMAARVEFSAIIFGDDITAVGGIKKMKEIGKRVPQDVAVTGFNNSIFAECCDPELTSVDNKVETVASLSVRLLQDLMGNKNVSSSIMIRPDLVVRDST